MKKALIVLLLLAFVAGGLFAQFTVSGDIEAGMDLMLGAQYDDPRIAVIANNAGVWGGRLNLNFTASNEAKNAGLFIRLRAHSLGNSAAAEGLNAGINDFIHTAYGWLSFFDKKLTVYAGKFQNAGSPNPIIYAAKDPLFDGDSLIGGMTGLLMLVRPVEMLSFSAAAVLPNLATAGNLSNSTAYAWNVVGEFGLGLHLKPLDFLLDLSFGKKADNKYTFTGNDVDMMFGINVKAISMLSMIFTGKIMNLATYSDNGEMVFAEYFGFSLLDKKLGLNLGFMEGVNAAPGKGDLFFKAWFWGTFALMDGKLVPRLDFIFAMGGDGVPSGLDKDQWYYSNRTYSADDMNLAISPSVQFKLGSSFFEIGYYLDFALSASTRKEGASHHIFLNLKAAI